MKQVIYLTPSSSSFHFFIYDCISNVDKILSEAKYQDLVYEDRFYQESNIMVIGTKSDYLPVKLTFETLEKEASYENNNVWEKVIRSRFEINNGFVKLFDPPAGKFASIEIPNGKYHIKIYYGENENKESELSNDFYLFQIWPFENS